jgi:GNAT superfamily N-acetyltransferase
MPAGTQPEIRIRPATLEDVPLCGKICYDAFFAISQAHGFPCDLPSAEVTIGILSMLFSAPGFYCIVAEIDGRIVGSNVLDERAIIYGVGPITIDPTVQNQGTGRKLMQAVLDRAAAQGAAGVRLVQAAFHNRSLSLYTSLGFDVREPLCCMQGRTATRSLPGCSVRAATSADLAACDALSVRVHGFDRGAELAGALAQGTALIAEREGRITGYASSLAFFGHATGETNLDIQALIASADGFGGPGILVPTRNSQLFRWCLSNGLRVVEPMNLMSLGLYNEPAGACLPSISF